MKLEALTGSATGQLRVSKVTRHVIIASPSECGSAVHSGILQQAGLHP
jgi:hypothetical protein